MKKKNIYIIHITNLIRLLMLVVLLFHFASCQDSTSRKVQHGAESPQYTKVTKEMDPVKAQLFAKAGSIKIHNKIGAIIGTSVGGNIFEISLFDIEKFAGHVDGDLAAGFIMNKVMLKKLFPDTIPIRGKVLIATPQYNPLVLVSSYITGAKIILNKNSIEESNLYVDATLKSGNLNKYIFIFGVKNSDIAKKVIFDKTKVLRPEDLLLMELLQERIKEDVITKDESAKLRSLVDTMLKNVITKDYSNFLYIKDTLNYTFEDRML